MAVMNSNNWVNLCLTDARKWFSESLEDFESMISKLYSTDTSDQQEESDMSYEGVGNFQLFTGTAIKDDLNEGYKTNFNFPEFMQSVDIKRKLWDDRKDRTVMNMVKELGLAYNRTKEAHAAEIFNYAFSAVDTFSSGNLTAHADGKALCAIDHPSKAKDTYSGSNYKTTVFSPTEVELDRQDMMKITDGKGNKVQARMKMLLIPTALEETGWEIINSTKKVNTAENNANFHEGRYKLAVWEELTDSNNWFSIDEKRMKRALWWLTRVAIENYKKFDEDLQILTFGGYARHGLNANSWRWLIGHKVAG